MLALAGIPCVPQLAAAMFCVKLVRLALAMWLPLYLAEQLHYSRLQAGLASTAFDLGGVAGSPLLGWLVDRC